MSAGSCGRRPDFPASPGEDRPVESDAAGESAAPAPVDDEDGPDNGFANSRWQSSDWDGLLSRPPGLLVSPALPVQPPDTSDVDAEASWASTCAGIGWPASEPSAATDDLGSPATSDQDPLTEQEPEPGTSSDTALSLLPTGPSAYDESDLPSPSPSPSPPPGVALPAGTESTTGAAQPSPPVAGAISPAAASPVTWKAPFAVRTWPLRRLATVCTAVLLLTVLTAYLASATQPTVYGAQADVLFEVTGSAQEFERQLATQEVLLGSRGVLAPVADRFDVPLRELTGSQGVEQIAGSQVLRTEVRNQDPDLAVRLAQAIADSYVASVTSVVTDISADEERRILNEITDLAVTAGTGRARLDVIASERAAAVTEGGTLTAAQEERELQLQDTALSQRIGALQSRLTEIFTEREKATQARVLTPAYLLDDPVGPRPLRAAAAGAMVGLVLASGLLLLVLRHRATP